MVKKKKVMYEGKIFSNQKKARKYKKLRDKGYSKSSAWFISSGK